MKCGRSTFHTLDKPPSKLWLKYIHTLDKRFINITSKRLTALTWVRAETTKSNQMIAMKTTGTGSVEHYISWNQTHGVRIFDQFE